MAKTPVAPRVQTQAETAKVLGVDQPKVSALLRGKLSGFSTGRSPASQCAQAWLSSATSDAIDRIDDVGPWALSDGTVVFNNKAGMAGAPLANIDRTENGAQATAECVWTGTNTGGRKAAQTCIGFTSASTMSLGSLGYNVGSSWTSGNCSGTMTDSCSASNRLYCIEQ